MSNVGQYFPISVPDILSCIQNIVQEWEHLGMTLQIPPVPCFVLIAAAATF